MMMMMMMMMMITIKGAFFLTNLHRISSSVIQTDVLFDAMTFIWHIGTNITKRTAASIIRVRGGKMEAVHSSMFLTMAAALCFISYSSLLPCEPTFTP